MDKILKGTKTLFTPTEMRKKLGVSEATFIKWKRLGIIKPTVNIGNIHRYDWAKTIESLEGEANV